VIAATIGMALWLKQPEEQPTDIQAWVV